MVNFRGTRPYLTFYFLIQLGKSSNDASRLSGAEDSGARYTVSRWDDFRGPGIQLAWNRVRPVMLTPAQPLSKRWGPLPELRNSTYGTRRKPPCPSWSGILLWAGQA